MSQVAAAPPTPTPPDSCLPPPGAPPEVIHHHFLRQAALANWNAYRLTVLIRRMAECDGHELYGCASLARRPMAPSH